MLIMWSLYKAKRTYGILVSQMLMVRDYTEDFKTDISEYLSGKSNESSEPSRWMESQKTDQLQSN